MKKLLTVFAALLLAFLTACRSVTSDKNYLLMPDETLRPGITESSVFLSNVTLPPFLNRKDIVRLVDNERIVPIPNCQWAMSLDRAVRDTLEQNLAILLGQEAIASRRSANTVSIDLTFRHFEITDSNQLRVRLLIALANRPVVPVSFELPLKDYSSIAAVHNAALSRIAQAIVEALGKA